MQDQTLSLLAGVLAESHFISEDEVVELLARHSTRIGARDIALYLADYDQRYLVPMPAPKGPAREEVAIDATIAGRCFRSLEVQEVLLHDGGRRVWIPVVDGTERLGVLDMTFDAGEGTEVAEELDAIASLVAHMVLSKSSYGDGFEKVRRRRPMSLAAELLWQLLPPLTFGTDRVVITAALAPIHDLGGDAFDYAVNGDTAHFAVFDAMGHGLPAGMMATVAVAAYRHSRRRDLGLAETAMVVDDAIASHVGGSRFVTGVLAELDLASGRLRWCIAGHPRPVILRRGRIVRTLDAGAHVPFGLGARPTVGEESLQPDDRVLLYTDGITEARAPDGELFGLVRLADLISRASSEGMPPPETMRRLMHALLDHQVGDLRDDATALLVEWPGQALEELSVEGPDETGRQ